MNEELTDDLVAALEGPVEVISERRGYDKQRGVPDSVFWLTPADDRIDCRPVPVLAELEGTFAGAADDFTQFAARFDEFDYQYYLERPVIGVAEHERTFHTLEYDVVGIRANQLVDDQEIEERAMHEGLRAWFDRFAPSFETSLTVREHLPQPVIEWTIDFTMFGHDFETRVPFIVGGDEEISKVVLNSLPTPTIPGVVVVNGKYDKRDNTTFYHETAFEYPTLHPIRFREP